MAPKTRNPKSVLRLPLQKRAELALQKAVEGVIREHADLGLPLYVGRNGKVVELSPRNVRNLAKSPRRK